MARQKVSVWWKSLPNWLKRASQIIAAAAAIGSALTTGFSWVEQQITSNTNQRIDQLQMELQQVEAEYSQSLKRLELMTLIAHSPDNVAEIERVAYYYFVSLLITIGQTYLFRLFVDEKKLLKKIEAAKAKPKKKSGFMARLEAAQKAQQEAIRKQQQQQHRKR